MTTDFDIHIYYDGAMNRTTNKIGFDFIVFNGNNVTVAKLAKCLDRDALLVAEILAIQTALNFALQ